MEADLPGVIRVKLSSEEASSVSIIPVVSQEMPVRELIGLMLDIAGKDAARLQDMLARGTLVNGATRYRWHGWQADLESLRTVLSSFPDPEPGRPFAPQRCTQVLFRGSGFRIQVPRQALAEKTFLRRANFWDTLMQVTSQAELEYAGYSYRELMDRYRLPLSSVQCGQLRESARLVRYSELRAQIRSGSVRVIDFLVRRSD